MLYESEAPDTWKEPRLKALGRQLGQWTEKNNNQEEHERLGVEKILRIHEMRRII